METVVNRFGEKQTNWTSHIHPQNPDFMQVVKYMHIERKDGETRLYWRLDNASANDKHIIPNISLEESLKKFVDSPVMSVSESEFEQWLKSKNQSLC